MDRDDTRGGAPRITETPTILGAGVSQNRNATPCVKTSAGEARSGTGRERERDTMTAANGDSRAAACVSVAWLVLMNKPFFPLMAWVLIGPGAATRSLAALAVAPLYVCVPWLARRSGYAARLALPLVGLADTLAAVKAFGPGSGAGLYLVACGALAIVGFSAREATTARALVVAMWVAWVAIARGWLGAPLEVWPADDLAGFFALNAWCAASLAAFVGLRFATCD